MSTETGTLEVGKRADILVVEGDVAIDITALRKVHTVIKGGRIVKLNGQLLV